MTDREKIKIIEKVLNYVEKKGYKYPYITYDENYGNWFAVLNNDDFLIIDIHEILFSHRFAKALFGKNKMKYDDLREQLDITNKNKIMYRDTEMGAFNFEFIGESWQYHLQQMALEENYLEYIKRFLKEKEKNNARLG